MTEHFDVAVVGGQTSGLIAGALLAKRGRRVVYLDHGESGVAYRRKGLRLPLLPTLTPVLDGSPPLQRVHDELGDWPDLRVAARALDPVFQAVLPDHRVDFRTDRAAMVEELGAEFPELSGSLADFFTRLFALDAEISTLLAKAAPLPPRSLRERLRMRNLFGRAAHLERPYLDCDLFAGIPARHPLREILLGPLVFFGHLSAEAPSTCQAVRLLARALRGGVTFPDRIGGMQTLLTQAAERAGVTVRRGAVVKSIGGTRDRLREIHIAHDRHATTADFVIANTFAPFQELLPASKWQARFTLAQQATRPVGGMLVVNLVVRAQVIPNAMAEAVFLLNGRRNARDSSPPDPPLFVCRYPADRGEPAAVRSVDSIPVAAKSQSGRAAGDADSDHAVLSVACPVRLAEVAHSPDRLAVMRLQIMERLGRLIPFLRNFLVDTSLPAEPSGWDVEGEDVVRRVDPWQLHPIFEPTDKPLLGVAVRTPATDYRNLVYCGRDVVPGLGLEGEYVAALAAADLLQELGGNKWKPVH